MRTASPRSSQPGWSTASGIQDAETKLPTPGQYTWELDKLKAAARKVLDIEREQETKELA
jgi:hypothetical protein